MGLGIMLRVLECTRKMVECHEVLVNGLCADGPQKS